MNEEKNNKKKRTLKKMFVIFSVCALLLLMVMPTFAQDLNISGELITENLFTGANIVIDAIGGIVFLIVGIAFGAIVLRAIANMITSMRFF